MSFDMKHRIEFELPEVPEETAKFLEEMREVREKFASGIAKLFDATAYIKALSRG